MDNISLVTGANGHLGNNLVRTLIAKGETVRAGVRNLEDTKMFDGLDCELIYTEMTDAQSMRQALEGVDVLYHVAAVFKHWAKNPQEDIITPNVFGTEVVLEAARQSGVQKIIYVSSVAAVGHDGSKLNETHWNTEKNNAYYRSKILSEQKAWHLAKKYQLPMVSVLPSAMIGPNIDRLTDTMSFLESIRKQALPIDPNFLFNFVDVEDVAEGLYLAAQKGTPGERYILANEEASSVSDIVNVARTFNKHHESPKKIPKWLLYCFASLEELKAKLFTKQAGLIRSQVDLFYGVAQEYDISKSRLELGYRPRPPADAIFRTLAYLENRAV
jgi:dihydroflavonol-4-reductase